jgi:hypothetical protein
MFLLYTSINRKTSTPNQITPLFHHRFDVLAGISYHPPLTDPFFIEKQLENNLHDSEEKSQGFFKFLLSPCLNLGSTY